MEEARTKEDEDVHEHSPVRTYDRPFVDESSGTWTLSEYDVDCIAIGAGILGCGGGGNPYLGKLSGLLTMKSGKKIQVIHPHR